MKFSYSWLKTHLNTTASPQEIADALTSLGIEVEDLQNPLAKLNGFVVGHVITRTTHPNADRLSLCKVTDGSLDDQGHPIEHQVVCGAPNVRQDMKVAFARLGTVIPNTNTALKKGVIRGIESQGMLCSSAELELGEDSDGIMDLPAHFKVGQSLVTAFTEDPAFQKFVDPIFHVSITPNRSDCFSVYGLARDLAAKGLGTLNAKPQSTHAASSAPSPLTVTLDQPDDLHQAHTLHFCARVIENVTNGKSPAWVQERLRQGGAKAISAFVDVTNLMCLDLGRPMHVFDYHKLQSKNLFVTLSKGGETFRALNDKDYILPDGVIIIRDGQDGDILSLAGIMGGRDSAVDENTTHVVLESALFNPSFIAKAGQKTAILSDSRTRFERGVDPNDVEPLLDVATSLILEWCQGTALSAVSTGPFKQCPPSKPTINLSLTQLEAYSGLSSISLDTIEKNLLSLGFTIHTCCDTTQILSVTPPAFRHDITLDRDVMEEVLRLIGYDHIPSLSLPLSLPEAVDTTRSRLSTYLTTMGYNEAYTWSFVSSTIAELFGKGVPLEKPLNADMAIMRPSVLSGLLDIAMKAQKRSQPNVSYFEFAKQFHQTDEGTIHEIPTLTFARVHSKLKRHWHPHNDAHQSADIFALKAEVLHLLQLAGVSNLQIEPKGPSYYHPGRVCSLKQGKNILAVFGEIHPKVLQDMDVNGVVLGAEIFLDKMPPASSQKTKQPKAYVPAIYQSVTRDLAFWIDKNVFAGDLIQCIQKVDRTLIESVDVFDVYTGDKAPEGKKSVAVELTLQPLQQTLSLDEMSLLQNKIADAVQKTLGGQMRDHS